MTTSAHYSTNTRLTMHSSLISAGELQAQLAAPSGKSTVVIDCRFNLMDKNQGPMLYREGHIPGAYYFDLNTDLSSPVQAHGGRHPLPDFAQLEEKLRRAGVHQHSTIVVYDDSRMAYAARAWWLFRYMGHENVRILDGGFKSWLANKGAIDRRDPGVRSGSFKALLQPDWTVSRDDILAPTNLLLIDSREARRYQGLEEPIDPVAGCIPGAVNFFWQDVSDENGFVKALAWQKNHWAKLPATENLAVYCGSGVTACVNLFSLHLIGVDAKLYPGSWSDWCSYLSH